MGSKSKKGLNRGVKPQSYSERLSGKIDPNKFYLIDQDTGFAKEVSLLEFAVRQQANKIVAEQREQRKKALDLKIESDEAQPLEPEIVLLAASVAESIDNSSFVEDSQVVPPAIEAPRVRIRESIFDRIRPISLDGSHQLLLNLTEDGRPLDPDFRDHLIKNGDTAQVEFAVIEGIKRGFDRSREASNISSSIERR